MLLSVSNAQFLDMLKNWSQCWFCLLKEVSKLYLSVGFVNLVYLNHNQWESPYYFCPNYVALIAYHLKKNFPSLFSSKFLICLYLAVTQSNCYYVLIYDLTVHQQHLNFINHSYMNSIINSNIQSEKISLQFEQSLSAEENLKKVIRVRKSVQPKTFWKQNNLISQILIFAPYLARKIIIWTSKI